MKRLQGPDFPTQCICQTNGATIACLTKSSHVSLELNTQTVPRNAKLVSVRTPGHCFEKLSHPVCDFVKPGTQKLDEASDPLVPD